MDKIHVKLGIEDLVLHLLPMVSIHLVIFLPEQYLKKSWTEKRHVFRPTFDFGD